MFSELLSLVSYCENAGIHTGDLEKSPLFPPDF